MTVTCILLGCTLLFAIVWIGLVLSEWSRFWPILKHLSPCLLVYRCGSWSGSSFQYWMLTMATIMWCIPAKISFWIRKQSIEERNPSIMWVVSMTSFQRSTSPQQSPYRSLCPHTMRRSECAPCWTVQSVIWSRGSADQSRFHSHLIHDLEIRTIPSPGKSWLWTMAARIEPTRLPKSTADSTLLNPFVLWQSIIIVEKEEPSNGYGQSIVGYP